MAREALALTAERGPLLDALKNALRAVAPKTTTPILGNYLLTARAGELQITGTNLDQEATATVPADVATEGAATVQADALKRIVEKLPAGAIVKFETVPDGRVLVSAGRSKFHLPTLSPDDFPIFKAGEGEHAFEFEAAGSIVADILRRQKFAISSEETRFYLCGTYMHAVDNPRGEGLILRSVSTDGHRLARIDSPRMSGLSREMPGVIVPSKTVDMIEGLGKDAGEAPLTFEVTTRTIRISAGNVSIASKLIDGTFPDYVRVIPTQFAREANAPTLALIETVARVGTMSKDDKSRRVKCTFSDDRLTIQYNNNSDGSEAVDELDIEMTGETPFNIGFNSGYLAEILAQIGSDTVRIRLGQDAGQALVVEDKTAEGLFVLMPMRI